MKTLLLWAIVVLVAGVGSAQTTPFKSPPAGLSTPPVQTGPAQTKPAQAIPTPAVTPKPSCAATNAQPEQTGKLLQVQPNPSFLEHVPELAFYQSKPNELAFDRYTLSGIAVQVFKAKRPLQLLNPAASPQCGSGWDNVEWFPASGSGPTLKLFSINF
jgi:hypothetical protein